MAYGEKRLQRETALSKESDYRLRTGTTPKARVYQAKSDFEHMEHALWIVAHEMGIGDKLPGDLIQPRLNALRMSLGTREFCWKCGVHWSGSHRC